jgi:hypothetical protein
MLFGVTGNPLAPPVPTAYHGKVRVAGSPAPLWEILLMPAAIPLTLCLAAICLTGTHHSAVAGEPTPFSSDWLRDKSLVSVEYVRDRWEELEAVGQALKGFHRPGLRIASLGENGGRTRNTVHCVFRATAGSTEEINRFHARLTSMGFRFKKGEPTVLAYKVGFVAKARIEELVSQARSRITARLPELVAGLKRMRVRDGTDTYHYPRGGFLCLAFDDLLSKMRYEQRSCGAAMAVHLPSLGYMIQVFGASELEGGSVGPWVDPAVLQLVDTEVAKLVRLDPRAKTTRDTWAARRTWRP